MGKWFQNLNVEPWAKHALCLYGVRSTAANLLVKSKAYQHYKIDCFSAPLLSINIVLNPSRQSSGVCLSECPSDNQPVGMIRGRHFIKETPGGSRVLVVKADRYTREARRRREFAVPGRPSSETTTRLIRAYISN